MNQFRNILLPCASAICIVGLMSFAVNREKSTAKGEVKFSFQNYVGKDKLVLDSEMYKNALGQAYSISMFKYYIGNITLKRKNGTDYVSKEYFLMDEQTDPSKEFVLANVPEGDYTSMNFILGVDSVHNCSGAQAGALDPVNGMFWMWNTGYIFLKIEGHSSLSKSPGHIFEFHIGGFTPPANCIRNFTLDLKGKPLSVSPGKAAALKIKADASEIFKSPVDIDFSKNSSVTDFHNAKMIADNYKDMFSIL